MSPKTELKKIAKNFHTIALGTFNFVGKKRYGIHSRPQYSHGSVASVCLCHFLPVLHLHPALSYPFQAAGLKKDCLPSQQDR